MVASCRPGIREVATHRDGSAAPGSGIRAGEAAPAWLTTLDSAAGAVTTVRPPGQFDGEMLSWPGRLSRYGGDEASWD